jgi:predicted enzyme related to lactoylglutathione lyase
MEKVERASSFCHIVIPAPDLPRAKAFFEKIFGWTSEREPSWDSILVL